MGPSLPESIRGQTLAVLPLQGKAPSLSWWQSGAVFISLPAGFTTHTHASAPATAEHVSEGV